MKEVKNRNMSYNYINTQRRSYVSDDLLKEHCLVHYYITGIEHVDCVHVYKCIEWLCGWGACLAWQCYDKNSSYIAVSYVLGHIITRYAIDKGMLHVDENR